MSISDPDAEDARKSGQMAAIMRCILILDDMFSANKLPESTTWTQHSALFAILILPT